MGVVLLRAAPGQGVSRPPHTASRDCRNGSPLARAIPCVPAPECGVTREKEKSSQTRRQNDAAEKPKKPCISVSDSTRSAASRAGMAGWAGEGGGRFGERREYEAPTLSSTPRQHGMARHHTCQPRNDTHVSTARHATTKARQEMPRHHTHQPAPPPSFKMNSKKSELPAHFPIGFYPLYPL